MWPDTGYNSYCTALYKLCNYVTFQWKIIHFGAKLGCRYLKYLNQKCQFDFYLNIENISCFKHTNWS